MFKALVLTQNDKRTQAQITQLEDSDLPEGMSWSMLPTAR